jgi:hypothetical protein
MSNSKHSIMAARGARDISVHATDHPRDHLLSPPGKEGAKRPPQFDKPKSVKQPILPAKQIRGWAPSASHTQKNMRGTTPSASGARNCATSLIRVDTYHRKRLRHNAETCECVCTRIVETMHHCGNDASWNRDG